MERERVACCEERTTSAMRLLNGFGGMAVPFHTHTIESPTQPDGCYGEGEASAKNCPVDVLLTESVPSGLALFAHQGSL